MAKKVYAVRIGRTPGIYNTWDEAKSQVDGFKGARYKSFTTMAEAKAFMGGSDDGASPKAAAAKTDIVSPEDALVNLKKVTVEADGSLSITSPIIEAACKDKLELVIAAFEEAINNPVSVDIMESSSEVQSLIRKYDIDLSTMSFDENIAFVDGGGDKDQANNYESTRILFGVVFYDAAMHQMSLYRYAMEKSAGFDWLFRASNVAGEEMAALLAMYICEKRDIKQIKIYQDNNLPAKYYSGAFKKIHNGDDYALQIFINESIRHLSNDMKINFLYVPSEHAVSKSSEKKRKGTQSYNAQEGIEKLPFETAEFLNAISDRLADYKNN
ncbi:MAG: ribonuclease H family protein [Pseudobutyrivibrio sp.]|nr:ribonuclease H family protein [Pseudobutyrivibrio sp.]